MFITISCVTASSPDVLFHCCRASLAVFFFNLIGRLQSLIIPSQGPFWRSDFRSWSIYSLCVFKNWIEVLVFLEGRVGVGLIFICLMLLLFFNCCNRFVALNFEFSLVFFCVRFQKFLLFFFLYQEQFLRIFHSTNTLRPMLFCLV